MNKQQQQKKIVIRYEDKNQLTYVNKLKDLIKDRVSFIFESTNNVVETKSKKKKTTTVVRYAYWKNLIDEISLIQLLYKRYEIILRHDAFMIHLRRLIRRLNKYKSTMEQTFQQRVSSLFDMFHVHSETDLHVKFTKSNHPVNTVHHYVHQLMLFMLEIAQMVDQWRCDIFRVTHYLFNELSTFNHSTHVRAMICLSSIARIYAVLREYIYYMNEIYNYLVELLVLMPQESDVKSYLKGKQVIVYKNHLLNTDLDGYNIYVNQFEKYLRWDDHLHDARRQMEEYLTQMSSTDKANWVTLEAAIELTANKHDNDVVDSSSKKRKEPPSSTRKNHDNNKKKKKKQKSS